jgi:hypothetical protein
MLRRQFSGLSCPRNAGRVLAGGVRRVQTNLAPICEPRRHFTRH